MPRPGSKASCLLGSAMTGCSRRELAWSTRAVGSKMMHRLCKSLPNPHPSVAVRHLTKAFFPLIADLCTRSSHHLFFPPVFATELQSKRHYNRRIVISPSTYKLGTTSFFPLPVRSVSNVISEVRQRRSVTSRWILPLQFSGRRTWNPHLVSFLLWMSIFWSFVEPHRSVFQIGVALMAAARCRKLHYELYFTPNLG